MDNHRPELDLRFFNNVCPDLNELIAQRKRAVDEWNAWRVRVAEDIAEVRPEREPHGGAAAARKEKVEEEEDEEIEVWIDEVIEQFEEVVE
ncbi:hypothetical protein EDB85DRAFT_2286890 [Lactarius pseudohatsudake]|nr:hypothetical protein EDB85DRAFT_2286890 [Lactarius pseudohatsudake]